MSQPNDQPPSLENLADAMKRDWDDRARENAKWYINTIKKDQSDAEFDASGKPEVTNFVLADPLLVAGCEPKQLRLLEIGCGLGRMTKHLAEVFGEVHATDVSDEMIAQARERLRAYPNVFLYATNGLDFAALPDDYFDRIFSVYVFQHVPDAAVIHSNIRAACRVLKPGGLFKFQVCGIDHETYARMPKDTWTGAPFTAADIRHAARASQVKLVSIQGYSTQYCWVMLRKPLTQTTSHPQTRPQIEFFGRTDDPAIKAIPTNGEHASLTLIAAGLERDEADANSVIVEIDGQDYWPIYVGPVIDKFAEAHSDSAAQLTQINLSVNPQMPRGQVGVCVKMLVGEKSEPVTLELLEPEPIIPQIILINNAVDGGLDVQVRGEKAVFRVFATGLGDAATPDNVRLQVNERILEPLSVTFIPANAAYMTVAKLPAESEPGEVEVRLHFGQLVSEPEKIRLLE
jgi:ubiquinone/menaquinone biosynthesis C-methylase UbiE